MVTYGEKERVKIELGHTEELLGYMAELFFSIWVIVTRGLTL